jgi:hypothetical protein
VFKSPVVAADGVTYEEEAVLRHFATFASTAGGGRGAASASAPQQQPPASPAVATSPLT